jgi:hypothetical protein
LGAAYWQALAAAEEGRFAEPFRTLLICPDDDAPLDWREQEATFVCPHCSRGFQPDGELLSLLPANEPYALTPAQMTQLAEQDHGSPDPVERFGPLWNRLREQAGGIPGRLVLDLCSGRGWAARWFASQAADVAALDAVSGENALGALRSNDRAITLLHADACRIPLAAESVDIVFCCDTIARLRRPERLLKEVGRILKPEGVFLSIGEPIGTHPVGSTLRDHRQAAPLSMVDYVGLFREGGMTVQCVFADDPAVTPKRSVLGRLRRYWRENSSTEARILVGKMAPDFQLPQFTRQAGPADG